MMAGRLPAGWTLRHPTLRDIPAILALACVCDVAAVGEPSWTAEEITETLTARNHDPARDSWLVYDGDGLLIAWAYLNNPARKRSELIEIYGLPGSGEPALRPLLELALARVAERARAWGYDEMLARAAAIASETRYIEVLRDAGFTFARRHAGMSRRLTGAEGPPDLPPGVVIRPLRPGDEADLRTFFDILEMAFADTPDYSPAEYDDWRQSIESLPSVSFDEWYVAEVDGVAAGVLQSSDHLVGQDGAWVRNLAVLRGYRRRGIGGALLATAFATYAGKGRTAVGLGVDVTNPTGAYRLYASVGMTPSYEADVYERVVRA